MRHVQYVFLPHDCYTPHMTAYSMKKLVKCSCLSILNFFIVIIYYDKQLFITYK